MQEIPVLFGPANIDKPVLQSSRAMCEISQIALGRIAAGDKPWITQEVADMRIQVACGFKLAHGLWIIHFKTNSLNNESLVFGISAEIR